MAATSNWASSMIRARSGRKAELLGLPLGPLFTELKRPPRASAAAMRLIVESSSAEVDVASGQQPDRRLGRELLAGGFVWLLDAGAVGRAQVGHEHPPAV